MRVRPFIISILFIGLTIDDESLADKNTERRSASSKRPAPEMIPILMDQNRYARSDESLTAFLKRTMESAPTIPKLITRLDCIASIIAAVITGIIAKALLKPRL